MASCNNQEFECLVVELRGDNNEIFRTFVREPTAKSFAGSASAGRTIRDSTTIMPRYAISHQPHDDLRLQRTGVALSKYRAFDASEVVGQHCGRTTLVISPQPAVSSHRVDYFGNPATFFSIQELHWQLVLTANHLVDVSPRIAPQADRSPPWEVVRDRLRQGGNAAALDVYQFAFGSRYASPSAELADYARASFPAERPLVAAAMDLMRQIHADFQYDPKATTISTPLQQVFGQRRGVCQDFAHLQISVSALIGSRGPLCERLFANDGGSRQSAPRGGRRDRMRGFRSIVRLSWLDRPRPDE